MPALKKNSQTRRRRNKASTASTLSRLTSEATPVTEYEEMTIAQLREAIDLVNQTRPADAQIPKKGAKALLVELLVASDRQIPEMPPHPPKWVGEGEDSYEVEVDWHPQTEAWWNDVWTSPMAPEWDDSDVHNVTIMALLVNDLWTAETPKARKEAAAEIRLQRQDLGLAPYPRRRLEWTFESADEARAKGEKRRAASRPAPPKPPVPGEDPRLKLVGP